VSLLEDTYKVTQMNQIPAPNLAQFVADCKAKIAELTGQGPTGGGASDPTGGLL
jgi:hypothetical protein